MQIEQVLINLATNAMQAMAGAPGRIVIRLDTVVLDRARAGSAAGLPDSSGKAAARTVRLSVSDDGPGMDAATADRIFEPFFTTKPVNEGTGLGLSVVHGIVQSHDGAIEVDTAPGKGTTFTLYLPAAKAEEIRFGTAERQRREFAAARDPAAAPRSGAGVRILCIDDDDSLVLLVKRMLERRGIQVSGYTDQGEALAALRADPDAIDLVVSDYNMPGMSGLDVAREVHAIRADLPVAIASGFIDEALSAQASGAGVRELIFKADTAEDLCDAFERLASAIGRKT
jgi:CheY-like chemotaxis protein